MISPKPVSLPVRIDSQRHPSELRLKPDQSAYRPRRMPVTIAIGFVYDGGLLFCADTKVTTNIKTNESKIVHFVSNNGYGRMVFAMSSTDINFPKSAIEKCWESVCEKVDFATDSIEKVHNEAEKSLSEFYRDHIYPHPDRTPGATFLELLVGIWLRGENRLYVSHETVLNSIETYECIGSGAYLAKYLIGNYQQANPGANSLQDAELIARHAVQSAIDYDEYCGGNPEMIIIRNDGEIEHPTGSCPNVKFMKGFFEIMWKLPHDLANMKNEDFWSSLSGKRIDEVSKQIRKLELWEF
jgi:hypothetical protein